MKEARVRYRTYSDQETIGLGRRVGALLRGGDVLALAGELGSGKTWFTKGVAVGLEIPSDTIITSPSFTLVNEYEGRWPLYHMDAYRLGSLSEFVSAGLEEYFYMGGVVVMEWADRWPEILPDLKLKVEFVILDEFTREITFSGNHPRAGEIVEKLKKEP